MFGTLYHLSALRSNSKNAFFFTHHKHHIWMLNVYVLNASYLDDAEYDDRPAFRHSTAARSTDSTYSHSQLLPESPLCCRVGIRWAPCKRPLCASWRVTVSANELSFGDWWRKSCRRRWWGRAFRWRRWWRMRCRGRRWDDLTRCRLLRFWRRRSRAFPMMTYAPHSLWTFIFRWCVNSSHYTLNGWVFDIFMCWLLLHFNYSARARGLNMGDTKHEAG